MPGTTTYSTPNLRILHIVKLSADLQRGELLLAAGVTPSPKDIRIKRVKMTDACALLIKLMEQYSRAAYRLTLLEIQKLAYFLHEAGEPLKLKFEAGLFGPYAANLNKVLQTIEGHFTRGYGDSPKPDNDIELLPGAVEAADAEIVAGSESSHRLARVAELIEGFETPYGMELLSSVHWVIAHQDPRASSGEAVVEAVHAWNDRKRKMFKPQHILVARERLIEFAWVEENTTP